MEELKTDTNDNMVIVPILKLMKVSGSENGTGIRLSENVFWSPADVLCPEEYIMTNKPWSGLGTED